MIGKKRQPVQHGLPFFLFPGGVAFSGSAGKGEYAASALLVLVPHLLLQLAILVLPDLLSPLLDHAAHSDPPSRKNSKMFT
jgi:hypothetical protein